MDEVCELSFFSQNILPLCETIPDADYMILCWEIAVKNQILKAHRQAPSVPQEQNIPSNF